MSGNVQRLGDWESPLVPEANAVCEKYVDSWKREYDE